MPSEPRRIQRAITVEFLNKRRLNAPAVWLQPESSSATAEDQVQSPDKLNTVIDDWLSPSEDRNLGIRLINGFVELQITSPDDIWAKCLFEACDSLHVDARAAFGGSRVSSIIFQVDKPAKLSAWDERWPRGHKDKAGAWVGTKLAYSPTPTKAPWVDSRPLPGSRINGELVVWRPKGKPAAEDGEIGLEDLEYRPIAGTNIESICRAIAFATLAYWIRVDLDGLEEWDESLTRLIGGWLANLVREGKAINEQGKSLEGVCWAPVDSPDTVSALLSYTTRLGAGKDLGVSFLRAEQALERNPQAPVPNWRAIETRFGPQAMVGIRHAFRAGIDISLIEEMSARYVLDTSEHVYLDRDSLLKGAIYRHKHDDLARQWENKTEHINGKPRNPFRLYAASSLRTDVLREEFRPGSEPGGLLRYSPVHGLLNGEDRQPDEYLMLNNFPGFHIKPIGTVDNGIMCAAVTALDRMLALLTQEKDQQILWLKKFLAWIVQRPEIKPQVCPIVVGGQGIGKSIFGDNLMRALFGGMAGTADAGTLSDNKFLITPFIGKIITFIDEVRLENVGVINTIKKLVRQNQVSGQVKFGHQHDYYIPSRLLIASNQVDIGLTPEDAADRCFFFIMAFNAENKRMTDREFQTWAVTLKPFYDDFIRRLETIAFRQHLMRYFRDLEVTREELEDLTHSSRDDENVVRATMSKSREVARAIVADARVIQGMDIVAWFNTTALREAIKRIDGPRTKIEPSQVLMEYQRAGIIELVRGDIYKFLYKYGTLVQKLGEAHGLPITNNWDYEPDDWGDNDTMSTMGGKPWRGNRQQSKQQDTKQRYDPDHMDAF